MPELDIEQIAGDREIPDDVRDEWETFQNYLADGAPYHIGEFVAKYLRVNERRLESPGLYEETRELPEEVYAIMQELGLRVQFRKLVSELQSIIAGRSEAIENGDSAARWNITLATSQVRTEIERTIGFPIYWELRMNGKSKIELIT